MNFRHPVNAASASLVLSGALWVGAAVAQDENPTTPGAIADPSTYQGSMQLQAQEQQQYQQVQQQNEQMQQRLDQNYQSYAPGSAGGGGSGGRSAPPLKAKPLLPPDKNPLLGRWQQTGGRPMNLGLLGALPGAAAMVNGAMSGGCQSIFGKGRVAFTPTAYNWVAPDGHEELLNHVEYRSDGANVILISSDPGTVPLIFGFVDHDHAVVAFLGCTMQRLVPGTKSAASPASGQAFLQLSVGAMLEGHFSPVPTGTAIWMTPQNPDENLVKAGFVPDPGRQPIDKLFAACQIGHGGTQESCNRGMQAMMVGALGVARTDAAGHIQTGALAPGRYYVVGIVPFQGHVLMWHLPVNLKSGANSLSLTPQNGSISQAAK